MGQPRYYRHNMKQLINSLQIKTKYHYFNHINKARYGLCPAEAELLADIAHTYFQNELLEIPEHCYSLFLYEPFESQKKESLLKRAKKKVVIPAFTHYDLELYQHYGLKAVQNYRLVTILDSIAFQEAKIDITLLSKIVNITPKSIRARLVPLLKQGIYFPLTYLSGKWSSRTLQFRYSKALQDFFLDNTHEQEIRKNLLITKQQWASLLFSFFHATSSENALNHFKKPLWEEIEPLIESITKTPRFTEYSSLYLPKDLHDQPEVRKKEPLKTVLEEYFRFSPALITDYVQFLNQEASRSNTNRNDGQIIYYAVSDTTHGGIPLTFAELVPISLTFFSEEDKKPLSPYNTTMRKWNKVRRYALETHTHHAQLSHYDLSFLLGVSVNVIKNLIKKHENTFLPTRGTIHDIGPGISHAGKIIKLYLEGYTETEITFKTGHSYESIENYLRIFTKIIGLTDLGLTINQIRVTTRITSALAHKMYDLYRKYDLPTYQWILAKIRNNFHQTIKKNKKDWRE